MRICILNPNSDSNTNEIIMQTANKIKAETDNIACISMKHTPKLIVSREDLLLAGSEMREYIREHDDNFDAFVIGCHADPCLEVMKEISKQIVVGIAECSLKLATMLGNNFSVIIPSRKSIFTKTKLCRLYGVEKSLRSIRVPSDGTLEHLIKAARTAVEEDGAEVIVLGCANYTGLDRNIEKELGVPVVDGIAASILYVKAMFSYKAYKSF